MNPARPFFEIFDSDPERLAIVQFDGVCVDRKSLAGRVYAFAEQLRQKGVQPNDRVLLQIPPGIELTVCILAVLWIGGVALLLESGLGEDIYLARARLSDPRWLVVHNKLIWVNRLPGVKGVLSHFEIEVPPVPQFDSLTQIEANFEA